MAFKVQEGKINYGFDPPLDDDFASSDPDRKVPWASAVKGSTNEVVRLFVPPKFASLVDLVIAEGATQVDINPKTGFNAISTNLILTGNPGADEVSTATINAIYRPSGQSLATLKVYALPPRTVSLGIYRVFDSNSAQTAPVGGPANATVLTTLTDIYKQAGIAFTDAGTQDVDIVDFDENDNGKIELEEYDAIIDNPFSSTRAIETSVWQEQRYTGRAAISDTLYPRRSS